MSRENLDTYKKMIGTRNRIVHDYDRVSNEILYKIATERLGDFDLFINDISKNINKLYGDNNEDKWF